MRIEVRVHSLAAALTHVGRALLERIPTIADAFPCVQEAILDAPEDCREREQNAAANIEAKSRVVLSKVLGLLRL